MVSAKQLKKKTGFVIQLQMKIFVMCCLLWYGFRSNAVIHCVGSSWKGEDKLFSLGVEEECHKDIREDILARCRGVGLDDL